MIELLTGEIYEVGEGKTHGGYARIDSGFGKVKLPVTRATARDLGSRLYQRVTLHLEFDDEPLPRENVDGDGRAASEGAGGGANESAP